MDIRRAFSKWLLKGSVLDSIGMNPKMDFMAFTGSACSPAFEIDLNGVAGIEQAYYRCSPLSSIIGKNAIAMSNAKMWITDKNDNDKSDKYKNLSRLLKKPNPLQSWKEFLIQLDTYRWLYGGVYVIAVKSAGFNQNLDANALWAIKPSMIEVELTGKLYLQSSIDDIIKRYWLLSNAQRVEIDKESILYIKDTFQNLNFSPTDISGKSRLVGLEDPIGNIIQANEAISSVTADRGAMGIISNETKDRLGSMPITPLEKQEIHDTYKSNYGVLKGMNKLILTDASLKYQQIGFNVKDLMLIEGIKQNIEQLSDALGYPFELLANEKGTTFNNQNEVKKRHYQDTIIPISDIYKERFNSFFGLERDSIIFDFSEVECMKEAEKERAETTYKQNQGNAIAYSNGIISLEEWRLSLNMDANISGTTIKEQSNGQEASQAEQN